MKNQTIIDISLPIHNNMLVWDGDDPVSVTPLETMEKDGDRTSRIVFTSHSGTHIDAPSHFLKEGTGVDAIDFEKLMGPCRVLDFEGINHLEILPPDLVDHNIKKGDRILFKTGNYKFLKGSVFPKEYVSLSAEGAAFLVEKGVVLVGTDFLGIEKRGSKGHPVHKTLLRAGIVNVEGLDLENVPEGNYHLICLPLRVSIDGSPARAVLVKNEK